MPAPVDEPFPARPLGELLVALPDAVLVQGAPDARITAVTHDSRRVPPGGLFVAVPGQSVDGRAFVPDALARGAGAIVAEGPVEVPPGVALVRVPAARVALAELAAAFYGHPSRRLTLIGVTGTDGKTTTTQLISAILEAHGLRTGWITTIDLKIGATREPNPFGHTTPEAPEVQATLARMVAAGVDVAVLEASSHGLALERLRGCAFRVAVFTNLSPEHLNFHGSMEQYRAAKARLFQFPTLAAAVLNADDPASEHFARLTAAPVSWYGLGTSQTAGSGSRAAAPAWFRAVDVALHPDRTELTVVRHDAAGVQSQRLTTRLLGRFNVANWLAAIAAASTLGATLDDAVRAADGQGPVRGRMERIELGQPFAVVVDFCHTPQALEAALDALRSQTTGRLLVAFGQAGGRDAENRPVMGAVAARKADFFVLTADDPLHEDPVEIARAIARGAEAEGRRAGRDFVIEPDRRQAIRLLLERARPGDAVLLAGKGHEQRQLVGDRRIPWDDARAAAELLGALGLARRDARP